VRVGCDACGREEEELGLATRSVAARVMACVLRESGVRNNGADPVIWARVGRAAGEGDRGRCGRAGTGGVTFEPIEMVAGSAAPAVVAAAAAGITLGMERKAGSGGKASRRTGGSASRELISFVVSGGLVSTVSRQWYPGAGVR
jgi:hypothetical protein